VPAAAYGAATEILTKRDSRPGLAISIRAVCHRRAEPLALALTFALEKGCAHDCTALMSLGTAGFDAAADPFLRSLSAILAGIVVLRNGYEPRISATRSAPPRSSTAVVGYGIPARRSGCQRLPAPPGASALRTVDRRQSCYGAAGVHGNRHLVNGGDVTQAPPASPRSRSRFASALAMAIGLERLRIRTGASSITSRDPAHGVCRLATVFGLMLLERRSSGPPMSAVCSSTSCYSLLPSGGAGVAVAYAVAAPGNAG